MKSFALSLIAAMVMAPALSYAQKAGLVKNLYKLMTYRRKLPTCNISCN